MLNNDEYVQESIGLNLYYLRTLREFCINVEKSLFQTSREYMDRAAVIAKDTEVLGAELISIADGRVSQKALDYNIFVTPYTLPMEELTEKIMNVEIDTNITKQELLLKSGNVTNASQQLVEQVENINKKAYELAERFIQLCQDVRTRQVNNEIFSYTYPSLYNTMIYVNDLFQQELGRIMAKTKTDPTFSITYQYEANEIMREIASYINGFADRANMDIIEESQDFINKFTQRNDIYKTTPLTPQNQKQITTAETELVKRFQIFMESILKGILDKKYQFIVAPIFMDNAYAEINFFLYILSFYHETEMKER